MLGHCQSTHSTILSLWGVALTAEQHRGTLLREVGELPFSQGSAQGQADKTMADLT